MLKAVTAVLNSHFDLLPLVDDGFTAADYAQSVGIGRSTASERLMKLALDGVVRRVRIKRAGGIRQGWQLIEKRK